MKLYIAGKVTGESEYKEKFDRAERWLRLAGYDVCNPTDYGLEDTSWNDAMRFLIPKLLECDGVAMLPDWRKSRGAILEVAIAERVEMACEPRTAPAG
jgi:hypothetical protein